MHFREVSLTLSKKRFKKIKKNHLRFQPKQAQLFNKLRLRRHLLHKRRAWPRRLALAGPSAWQGFLLMRYMEMRYMRATKAL